LKKWIGCGYSLEKIDFLSKGSLNLALEAMVPLNLIPFASGTDDEAKTTNLRTSPSQEGGDDEIPRGKGPTTRAMAKRIQKEWALNAHARPKMNFI